MAVSEWMNAVARVLPWPPSQSFMCDAKLLQSVIVDAMWEPHAALTQPTWGSEI